ncbi:MAG: nicotinamide mononucleotide transporter [Paludibacteraceae bacterium]|nr:nicotinamide mononucleotide transporter [Paludibacteraceae bacterium]
MTAQEKKLWLATVKNLGISLFMYSFLLGILWLDETFVESLKGMLLHFDDPAWIVGIPASIIGVAYILTIRNPINYTGFYMGIIMSALLGVQFLLQGLGDSPVRYYDSVALYFCVFIPFQLKSIINWKKPQKENENNGRFEPSFLSVKSMLLSLLVFILIVGIDYLIGTYLLPKTTEALNERFWVKFISGMMIASSVLANFWLIYRKNDSWIYWVIYSVSGILLFSILGNIFSIVLFLFFLFINGMAGISWIKSTPKKNYGWLIGK